MLWNKICSIFEKLKLIVMSTERKNNFIKATKEGRLYIKTSDFFKQKDIKDTIKILLDSDLIKEIEERKLRKAELEKA
jgi:hypothetical protein